ncbi:hypothetical protein OPT61_g3421 [Boeremia exigua]|uniref:Uncharacterized protein n=1 Tax=Boeremia exigua TaxID=749465 RepID=A0ACC2IHX9_9PLEO|nr:hypothetical protein OPT61_g3421 [Boeremia exigua]
MVQIKTPYATAQQSVYYPQGYPGSVTRCAATGECGVEKQPGGITARRAAGLSEMLVIYLYNSYRARAKLGDD